MKGFLRVFFLTIGLLLFSNGMAEASELNDVFSDMNCAQLKSDLVSVSASKSLTGVNFSYVSALNCNTSMLHKNLIVKMFYMMFGDFALKSMDIVVGITGVLTGQHFDFYEGAKGEVAGIEPFSKVIKIIQGITYAGIFFVLAFVSIFYLYYLSNSAHDGSVMGKATNVFWTSTRLFATIFLCIPISSFDDFTPIQVIVMIFATLGILLANVVWFIMPVFEYLYNNDLLEIQEKNEPINKRAISNIVDTNIQMHICDIQARKGVYLYGLDISDMTKENIEGSQFGKCIKDNENIENKVQGKGVTNFVPGSVNATRVCSISSNKELVVACGTMVIPDTDAAATLNSSFTGQTQNEIRKIAYDIIGRYCVERRKELNHIDEVEYAKNCSMVLNGSSFSYVPRYGKQVIATYENAPDASSIISAVNGVKDNLYATVSGTAANTLKTDTNNQEVSDKIAMSLIKGWMSSSSFILDVGSQYEQRSKKYNEVFDSVKVNSVPRMYGAKSLAQQNADVTGTALSREIMSSVHDIKEFGEQIANSNNYIAEKREAESSLMDLLFPAIGFVKDFNGARNPISTRLDANSCIEDFNQCARTSLNPLVSIMKLGRDLAGNSMYVAIAANLVEYGLGKLNNSLESTSLAFIINISGMLSIFFSIHAIFGLLITYIPAIIVFAFFVGNALGWFLLVCKKIIIAQLWMITHLIPNANEGFAGKGSGGYKLLIDILLRPAFIVFGVFVAFIMLSVMVSLLNVLFGIVLNTFVFFSSPSGVVELISNFFLHMVYIVLLLIVMLRSGKAMYKVPNALSEWFEMKNDDESGMWTEITNRIQGFMMKDVKKIMLIAG